MKEKLKFAKNVAREVWEDYKINIIAGGCFIVGCWMGSKYTDKLINYGMMYLGKADPTLTVAQYCKECME